MASALANYLAVYSVASIEAFEDSDAIFIPFAAAVELTVKNMLPESPDANISNSLPPSPFLLAPAKKHVKR